MNPSLLRLVAGSASPVIAAQPTAPAGDRRVFWRLFMNWLANADAAETEQLEHVLARHAHNVRPLVDAVSEALCDRVDAPRLPPSLIRQMQQAHWSPDWSPDWPPHGSPALPPTDPLAQPGCLASTPIQQQEATWP